MVGAGSEVLGWFGRTVAHCCSYSNFMNTMKTATLIMGPGKSNHSMKKSADNENSLDSSRSIHFDVDFGPDYWVLDHGLNQRSISGPASSSTLFALYFKQWAVA